MLNSAVVEELIPDGARVVDVGSGAGLPGIPLALARPDLHVTLIEPMLRRTEFLHEVVDELDADIDVVRGRVEEPTTRERCRGGRRGDLPGGRPLDKFARWCLPVVRPGGQLLAIKGEPSRRRIATSIGV